MTRESATVELTDDELLHGSDAVEVEDGGRARVADAAHSPAVTAVVPFAPKQRHAVQPAVITADAAQQQPPLHMFVPQSKDDEHVSPGEYMTHAPLTYEHDLHERSDDEQQNPPRHEDDAQDELDEHG